MASKLPSVVLFLRLNWLICSHSSEKYLRIKILKPWLYETCRFVNEILTCLPLPQRFQKIFSHKALKNFSEYIFRKPK